MSARVCFRDIFERVERPLIVTPGEEYNCVGVRWWGKGAFIRERKRGEEIKKQKQFEIYDGDITYNKLFAWRGAFAIADSSLSGCIVSDKFPTYRLISDDVLPEYLMIIFQSHGLASAAAAKSTGMAAISKFTLNPPKFWELSIPLIGLEQQHKIVDLVAGFDKRFAEALAANEELERATGIFTKNLAAHLIRDYPRVSMGSIGELVRRSVNLQDDVRYRQVTVAMNNRGLRLREEKYGSDIGVKNQAFVIQGDLVFSRIDIRNGAIGFVPRELDGAIVANDFPAFAVREGISKEYLSWCFATKDFREQSESKSAGATNRRKMTRENFLSLEVPLPDISTQQLIAARITAIDYAIRSIEVKRKETIRQMEDLRRIIFDEIFEGIRV